MGKVTGNKNAQKIVSLCEKHWEDHKNNCCDFAKAVADDLGISLMGQANASIDQMQKLPWKVLNSGVETNAEASIGKLVLGGLKDKPLKIFEPNDPKNPDIWQGPICVHSEIKKVDCCFALSLIKIVTPAQDQNSIDVVVFSGSNSHTARITLDTCKIKFLD